MLMYGDDGASTGGPIVAAIALALAVQGATVGGGGASVYEERPVILV